MAKTKQQKEVILKELETKLKNAKGIIFSNYIGLKVSEILELRKSLHQNNTELVVAKKSLLKKALKNNNFNDVDVDKMESGVAVAMGTDEVSPAKVMTTFAKEHEKVQFYGGIMESKFIDVNQIKVLSSLPSREELLAKVVGSIASPVRGFVTVLSGNLRGFVNVLNAIKDKK